MRHIRRHFLLLQFVAPPTTSKRNKNSNKNSDTSWTWTMNWGFLPKKTWHTFDSLSLSIYIYMSLWDVFCLLESEWGEWSKRAEFHWELVNVVHTVKVASHFAFTQYRWWWYFIAVSKWIPSIFIFSLLFLFVHDLYCVHVCVCVYVFSTYMSSFHWRRMPTAFYIKIENRLPFCVM